MIRELFSRGLGFNIVENHEKKAALRRSERPYQHVETRESIRNWQLIFREGREWQACDFVPGGAVYYVVVENTADAIELERALQAEGQNVRLVTKAMFKQDQASSSVPEKELIRGLGDNTWLAVSMRGSNGRTSLFAYKLMSAEIARRVRAEAKREGLEALYS